jgi:hypothetical protein
MWPYQGVSTGALTVILWPNRSLRTWEAHPGWQNGTKERNWVLTGTVELLSQPSY